MAPMEGVIDHTMREMFSRIGGLDRLTTEFIRVSNTVLPERVFHRFSPELAQGGLTLSHTPVAIQLLGDKPELMAASAVQAVNCGSPIISLNFGCPAKTVNKSCGGAFLLQWPEKLYDISYAVKNALPDDISVCAKIRLGFEDDTLAPELVDALVKSGVDEIAIHARTKKEGYKPPAHWHKIKALCTGHNTPIVANGEMWNCADIKQCIQESGCSRIMLGRGIVAKPDLALQAKNPKHQAFNYADILLLLNYYWNRLEENCPAKYRHSLIKQWLVYLRESYPEAKLLFEDIKRERQSDVVKLKLQQHLLAHYGLNKDQSNTQIIQSLEQSARLQLGGLDLQTELANLFSQ